MRDLCSSTLQSQQRRKERRFLSLKTLWRLRLPCGLLATPGPGMPTNRSVSVTARHVADGKSRKVHQLP